MNALKRGRGNKATPEEKKAAMQWQNERVKIANLIARKPEIPKICCICGKEGQILHNRKNPYYITFICNQCRTEPNNLIIAEESRFDLRTKLEKSHLFVNNFLDEQIIRIITEFMNNTVSIGDYCNQIGISRHQFGQVVQRYKKLFPRQNIEQLIKDRTKEVQSEKLKEIAEESRFDRRLKLNKSYSSTAFFSKEEENKVVEGYMKNLESIRDYCNQIGISRNKFYRLVDRYNKRYPKRNIYYKVKSHSNKMRTKLVREQKQNVLENVSYLKTNNKKVVDIVKYFIQNLKSISYIGKR